VSLTEHPTIFDAIRERDEAIASIDANTVDTFKQCARQAILNVGRMRPQFTSDHVWDWLQTHDSVQAHDNRALGAVMSKLHKDKLAIMYRQNAGTCHQTGWIMYRQNAGTCHLSECGRYQTV
jgi:hypothetical protein